MPFNTGVPLFTDYTCLCQVEILRHKSISSSYLIITIYSVLMKKILYRTTSIITTTERRLRTLIHCKYKI